jgi:D-alanine-D-alanine ligase
MAMEFYFCDPGIAPLSLPDLTDPRSSGRFTGPFSAGAAGPLWEGCDAAFLALHGTFGEDGVIQGYLDTIGIPYTGSGVFGSAIAMDKIASKFMYIGAGLSVPPYSVYGKAYPETTIDALVRRHGFPSFVKCPQSGSSRLLGKADNRDSLERLIEELSPHAGRLLVESSIDGPEFSCAILERDGALTALPPIEIRPVHADFFDYAAKYSTGGSEEIVPAPRPAALLHRIQQAALAAHVALDCSDVSRTDMIFAGDTLYVLETNTLPGLTPHSLLPKAFAAMGGTYGELLDILIQTTLGKKSYRTT